MAGQITAERVKQLYPQGAPVEVVAIKSHPEDIYPGTRGEVVYVDDNSVIHIRLNSGRILTAIYGVDYIKRIIDVRKRK